MSAIDAPKPVDLPEAAPVEATPATVEETPAASAPVEAIPAEEPAKADDTTVAPPPVAKDEKVEEKVVEPIYSGALGYKAPGLKNAFRFSKKQFWFGEEAVDAANLKEYLRGEKPEIAHSVAAWSSQTGKGLLFFVKHADQKEHPAGVLNLAYANDLVKDGAAAFSFKIGSHKHAFEAQTTAERDGWFLALEKAVTEAKASKDLIESSDGYKENKDKIAKSAPVASASSAPKKSLDVTPKLAEGEAAAAATEAPAAGATRTGSSSSSSDDEEKKTKKSKPRSASRKRTSLFGFVKKDKLPKDESAAAKTEPETKTEEPAVVPHLAEVGETLAAEPVATEAPVITQEIPQAGQEIKDEAVPAVAAAATDAEPTPSAVTPPEKPAVKKRTSIFGNFVEKLKSPTAEKKEPELVAPPPPAKDNEVIAEDAKPLEEAAVAAPATTAVAEPAPESAATKTEEKPTPSKEKEHFSFGKLFGSKERSKSPATADKPAEPKVDAAPQIQDPAPAVEESAPPVEPAAPVAEAKVEEETPKKEKRTSFFGNLSRSLSKATSSKKDSKPVEKKEPAVAIPEVEESKAEAPAVEESAPAVDAAAAPPAEATIGDVPAEAVTVGEASKGTAPVSTTA